MHKHLRALAGLALLGLLAACSNPSSSSDQLSQSDAQALSEAVQGDLQLTGAMLGDASTAALGAQGQVDGLEAAAQAGACRVGAA